jgi:holo-[acyl-carrier protein] synthase
MTVKGIGTDLLDQRRIEKVLQKQGLRFSQRILTPAEQAVWQEKDCPVNYLAKRFAAKEAIVKALGTGIAQGIGFQQIQVLTDSLGKPQVTLFDQALERARHLSGTEMQVSLSDEGEMILAFAVLS